MIARRLALAAFAATAAGAAPYDPRETFAPCDMGQPVNAYRSANGLPGPAYWQNRADYSIRATLDPDAKTLRGSVTIAYANNSPDTLDVLWLQIEQNLYKPGSRGSLAQGGSPGGNTEGMVLESASVNGPWGSGSVWSCSQPSAACW